MELASTDVVLDANVLIPAVLRDTLLRAAAAGLYRVHWSAETIDEVHRNLVRRRMTDEVGARRLVDTLRTVFPDAEVEADESIGGEAKRLPREALANLQAVPNSRLGLNQVGSELFAK